MRVLFQFVGPFRLRLAAVVLAALIALVAAGTLSHAGDPGGDPRVVDGGIAVDAGGQFLFWGFGGGTTASFWFGSLTIAWLFDTEAQPPAWVSYVPALGRTDFALNEGAVLWLVSPRALRLRPGGCPSPVLLCPPG